MSTKTLGATALDIWRSWRALPWQGLPVYGKGSGGGEYTWQNDSSVPAGKSLHRVLDTICTRPATESEEEALWNDLINGKLRIYTRRNGFGVGSAPVSILHDAADSIPSGLVN